MNLFPKHILVFEGHGKSFFGNQNVLFSNGEDYQRISKSLAHGFYDLSVYFKIQAEKGKLALKMMEKASKDSGIIEDVEFFTQRLTLDILGNAIFGHEFNSLEGSIQEDLNAYQFILEHILNFRYMPINSLFPNLNISCLEFFNF
jgi:hypothetical protein